MRVLSLHQPLASLVACGLKTIDTRSWSTKYRGRLAIHAAARKPDVEMLEDGLAGDELWGQWYETPAADWYPPVPPPEMRWSLALAPEYAPVPMPLGAIVATCTLVRCVPIVADWTEGLLPDWVCIDPGTDSGLRWTEPISSSAHGWKIHRCEDQRPYGDFTPGRYAWLLADIAQLDQPVPFKGGQGFTKSWEPAVSELVRGEA